MPRRKSAVTLERLSRNPRPSRQGKTISGRPVFEVSHPVEEIRESVGITQVELARASGIPRSAIANIELGRYTVSARDGIKLFTALARTASPESEARKKAITSILECANFQKELSRKALAEIECQEETLKERRAKHKHIMAEVESIIQIYKKGS
jgi:transcriptional regulator with XRE-family HTH domain